MADAPYFRAMAVGVQTALGTPNPTIVGLTGSLTPADGVVLGDRESGNDESGIVPPSWTPSVRENADVPGSFTKVQSSFQRMDVLNFQVTTQLKGNGAAATPALGEAQPLAGNDALLQMAGLVGGNGASGAEYVYTPRIATTPGGSTVYGTVKYWEAIDQGGNAIAYILQDCLVSLLEFQLTPGGLALAQFNIEVGAHDPTTQRLEETPPSIDYGTLATLDAPVVQDAGAAWTNTRGFQAITCSVENTTEDIEDSNQATGFRKQQTDRQFTVNGPMFADDALVDQEYQQAAALDSLSDFSFQIGTPAGATDIMNAYGMLFRELEPQETQPGKQGASTIWTTTSRATNATAGNEFALTFS